MAIVLRGVSTNSPKPTLLNSLSYMPHALIAPDHRKYEIIRVYAWLR